MLKIKKSILHGNVYARTSNASEKEPVWWLGCCSLQTKLILNKHSPFTQGMPVLYNLRMNPNRIQSGKPIEIDESGSQNRSCPPPTAEESQRRWAAWHQAMELSHEMLMMGLRQKIGPKGDLQAAYRDWYERYQTLKWDTNRAP